MPDARIITTAEAFKDAISTAWSPSSPNTISRVYVAPVSIDDLSNLTGRHIYVWPIRYSDQPENRGETRYFMTLGVLIVERYTTAGFPPNAWMDALVYFVENTVKPAVDYDGTAPLAIGSRKVYTEKVDVDVYDAEKLNQKNLFWSELEVELWEVAA